MKNSKLTVLALGMSVMGFFAFSKIETGSIKGTVVPADGATTAWAISTTDTLKDALENGVFEITGAKAGTYTIVIEAKAPNKNAQKEGVAVTAGQVTDIGEIKLAQ